MTQFHHDLVLRHRRIAYLDVGEHPRTCLLIHGFCASSQYWVYTLPKLAETHRVVAIDLPGFGDSELPQKPGPDAQVSLLNEFCHVVETGPVDVIGHSMGTWAACELAARYPDLVRSLVLSGGPAPSVVDLSRSPLLAMQMHPREVFTALLETATAWLPVPRRALELVTSHPWARRLVFTPYVRRPEQLSPTAVSAVLNGFGAAGAIPTLRHGAGYDLRPALDQVRCPVLVIAGTHDRLVPETDIQAFVDADPTRRHLHILNDTGHMPMLERPDRFNELVGDFLDTTT